MSATYWRPIEEAPRDGSEVWIKLDFIVAGFWVDELKGFVLSRPLSMEMVSANSRAALWRPTPESPGAEQPDIHGEPERDATVKR